MTAPSQGTTTLFISETIRLQMASPRITATSRRPIHRRVSVASGGKVRCLSSMIRYLEYDSDTLGSAGKGSKIAAVRKHWENPIPEVKSTVSTPVPRSFDIGAVRISPATVLAPMAGVTDTVFRRFIRNLGGCGLMMTEFTSADGILRHKDRKAQRYLTF